MKNSKKITINDIAKQIGVSKTAVSFAFNTPEKLPVNTVNKILKKAEEMGYSPDPLARSMATKKTGNIGLLFPQSIQHIVRNPFFNEFIAGIGDHCEKAGCSLLLVPPKKGSMSRAVSTAVVDGFITLGLESYHSAMSVIKQRQVPFVMVDSDPEKGIACVNINDSHGSYLAMRHLLELGHRSIVIAGFINPSGQEYRKYHGVMQRRVAGYIQALNQFGLAMESPSIRLRVCEVKESAGRQLLKEMLAHKNLPTAVISMSDTVAIGVMEEAQAAGIKVPEELSLVGFDDIPEASLCVPKLTTVVQPSRKKGRLAAQLLTDLLAGRIVSFHHLLDTHFVKRGSTAPPYSQR